MRDLSEINFIRFFIPIKDSPIFLEILGKLKKSQGTYKDINKKIPISRVLFLFYIPKYIKHNDLNVLFSKYGKIEKIVINEVMKQSNKDIYNTLSYIIYNCDKSIENIENDLITNKFGNILYLDYSDLLSFSGNNKNNIKKKITNIIKLRSNPIILEKSVNTYMTKYDLEKQIEEENIKNNSMVSDADGFIKVTGKVTKGIDGTIVHSFKPDISNVGVFGNLKVINKRRYNKEEKNKTVDNFYKFQIKEKKRREIDNLKIYIE
ncbi:uncharacterized protein CMU_012190 [Cryptosporidium muris RN66]|uniref:Ribosomal RNA-processing protein 7 C-terminal domain-containing protein n=1 Tax=Cryptosporidium muris (strain RN66) TaxID=441375 RepID=B6AEC8_CRYMR|nr:uncharacterized protein CMU_012190 [Cryptosporidium muris RN66]EEA06545.1 hypothetical protein, conserved [Cryptosporidium muris RN66]|eukprot:XP_002140894.1 hypothetical protein [Cryptosporidium muris RN66]